VKIWQADGESIRSNLMAHVRELAETIGERNPLHYEALVSAEEYISARMQAFGYELHYDTYTIHGREYRNVVAEKESPSRKPSILVVGAHYDSAFGTPGADDNASAVAVLLETARLLTSQETLSSTIRMVFFTLEEPPYFRTPKMGSMVHAKKCKAGKHAIAGMISLEMVGYFSDRKGSQALPLPGMQFLYPTTGNFLAVAGNFGSRRLVRSVSRALREHGRLPIESLALPLVPYIGLSDHWSFWQFGYPAIIVTDTAFLRNPHYHAPSDLPSTLDYGMMADIVSALVPALGGLRFSRASLQR
jgi:hypothetical protein